MQRIITQDKGYKAKTFYQDFKIKENDHNHEDYSGGGHTEKPGRRYCKINYN